jgi:hypothetical protein
MWTTDVLKTVLHDLYSLAVCWKAVISGIYTNVRMNVAHAHTPQASLHSAHLLHCCRPDGSTAHNRPIMCPSLNYLCFRLIMQCCWLETKPITSLFKFKKIMRKTNATDYKDMQHAHCNCLTMCDISYVYDICSSQNFVFMRFVIHNYL